MIHMRFVKDGKITGYGRIIPYEWIYAVCFQSSPDGNAWRETPASEYPCGLIERGIEVRGEVWYEGDRFIYDGQPGTLKWNGECGMFTLNLDDFPFKTIKVNMMVVSCTKHVGNIHEGDKP